MTAVTWERVGEATALAGTVRAVYRLSHTVRFCEPSETCSNRQGSGRTRYVIVSWGREGDTCIFPSSEDGRVLDWLGWSLGIGWQEHDQALWRWLAGDAFDGAPTFDEQVSS